MDRIEGEEEGSFIKGILFGFIVCACLIYICLPEVVIENASKVFFYEDSIHCKKSPDLGNRVVKCDIGFKEFEGIKKVFCYSKGEGLSCQIHASDEFVTPEYLKDLY